MAMRPFAGWRPNEAVRREGEMAEGLTCFVSLSYFQRSLRSTGRHACSRPWSLAVSRYCASILLRWRMATPG
eukprot:scaffold10660_cov27-Tisochrysis_lutea.AAC.2